MDRRQFLADLSLLLAATTVTAGAALAQSAAANRTQWQVRGSEGFDAIAFLGPLSGNELYLRYYAQDAEAFGARIPQSVRNDIAALWKSATDDGFGLLGPTLCVLFSNGNDATIDTVLTALEAREFRAERLGADFAARSAEVRRALNSFDVITWQQKLTGRTFDPTIESSCCSSRSLTASKCKDRPSCKLRTTTRPPRYGLLRTKCCTRPLSWTVPLPRLRSRCWHAMI